MSRLVEFRSDSRNLQIWIPTGGDSGFSKKFTDGVLLVTEEEAAHMRNYHKCGSSYHEVKKGAVLPPRPKPLEPVIVRHPSEETPAHEREFKEAFGATTEEFEPPAQHIHVMTSEEEAAAAAGAPPQTPDELPSTSAAPANAARQPIRKATTSKENTDVSTQ